MINFESLILNILTIIIIVGTILYVNYRNSLKIEPVSSQFTKLEELISELTEEELTEEEQKKQQEDQYLQLNSILTPYIDEISNQIVQKVTGSVTEANKSLRTLQANAGKQERQILKEMEVADFESFIEMHPDGELIQAAIDSGLVPKAWLKALKKNPMLLEMFLPRLEPYLAEIRNKLQIKSTGDGPKVGHPYANEYQ